MCLLYDISARQQQFTLQIYVSVIIVFQMVSCICSSHELESEVVQKLMELVFELLCRGDLMLAKVLRKKIIEKCAKHKKASADMMQMTSMNITSSISLAYRFVL